MENPLPLAPDGLARGVRIGRHAAGVLLILPIILAHVSVALFMDLFPVSFQMCTAVKSILCSFLCLIAYFLLWRIASDAPTKKSMLLLGASILISLVIMKVVVGLVAVYAFSLLLRNRRLGTSERSWIGLLAVGQCNAIIYSFSSIWFDYITASDLSWSYLWTYSGYYQIFSYGWAILCIIAVWRLAHCPLFAGRREATEPLPAGFYSPLNRYMAAVVIASAVAVGALTLLYANADQIVG